MWSDEIYDLLLSTIPCFSGAFVMTNGTEKKKGTERKSESNVKWVDCWLLRVKKPVCTCQFQGIALLFFWSCFAWNYYLLITNYCVLRSKTQTNTTTVLTSLTSFGGVIIGITSQAQANKVLFSTGHTGAPLTTWIRCTRVFKIKGKRNTII